MGLDSHSCPDEDELFITALMLDRVYAELKGVNKAPEEMIWTERRIEKIQVLCHKTLSSFSMVANVLINAKIPHLLYHVKY